MAKARPLAEAEAKAIAAAAEKAGGGAKLKDVAGKRPVITTEPRAKLAFAPMMEMGSFGRPRPDRHPRASAGRRGHSATPFTGSNRRRPPTHGYAEEASITPSASASATRPISNASTASAWATSCSMKVSRRAPSSSVSTNGARPSAARPAFPPTGRPRRPRARTWRTRDRLAISPAVFASSGVVERSEAHRP